MYYTFFYALHIACVVLTFAGFVLRGYWMSHDSHQLQARWVRILPHVIDTLLLASGVGLIFTLGLSPTRQPWLAAKLSALVIYIVLGSIALKRGKTRTTRLIAFSAAVMAFGYILAVALTHRPVPTFL